MRKFIYLALLISSVLVLGCSENSNILTGNEETVIFSQSGLMDSTYNSNGAYNFKVKELGQVDFETSSAVRVRMTLNIHMGNYYESLQLWVGGNPWYTYTGVEGLIYVDVTLSKSGAGGILQSYLYTNYSGDYVSVRDLVISKIK